MISRVLVLFGIVVIGSCGELRPGFNQYDLSFNETVNIDSDKRLKFTGIVRDQRCPVDQDPCAEDDFAAVQFRATSEPTDTVLFNLRYGSGAGFGTDTVLFNAYMIRISNLLPERYSTSDPAPEDYSVRVSVEKLK